MDEKDIVIMKCAVESFRNTCHWISDKVFKSFAEDMEDYIIRKEIELEHGSEDGDPAVT